MLHVNLISERLEERRKNLTAISLSIVIALIVLIASSAWSLRTHASLRDVEQKIESVKKEMSDIADEAEQVAEMKQRIKMLKPVHTIVGDVQSSVWAWLRVLRDLHNAVPDDVWLEEVRSTFDSQTYKHVLRGRASTYSYRSVGDCLRALQRTDSFDPTGVKIVSIDRSEESVDFQLELKLAEVIGEYYQ